MKSPEGSYERRLRDLELLVDRLRWELKAARDQLARMGIVSRGILYVQTDSSVSAGSTVTCSILTRDGAGSTDVDSTENVTVRLKIGQSIPANTKCFAFYHPVWNEWWFLARDC